MDYEHFRPCGVTVESVKRLLVRPALWIVAAIVTRPHQPRNGFEIASCIQFELIFRRNSSYLKRRTIDIFARPFKDARVDYSCLSLASVGWWYGMFEYFRIICTMAPLYSKAEGSIDDLLWWFAIPNTDPNPDIRSKVSNSNREGYRALGVDGHPSYESYSKKGVGAL